MTACHIFAASLQAIKPALVRRDGSGRTLAIIVDVNVRSPFTPLHFQEVYETSYVCALREPGRPFRSWNAANVYIVIRGPVHRDDAVQKIYIIASLHATSRPGFGIHNEVGRVRYDDLSDMIYFLNEAVARLKYWGKGHANHVPPPPPHDNMILWMHVVHVV